jgi:hypothetical protein
MEDLNRSKMALSGIQQGHQTCKNNVLGGGVLRIQGRQQPGLRAESRKSQDC